MDNATPTLSWPPVRRPAVPPLSRHRISWIQWLDPALKLLVPALLLVALVLALNFGSFTAYMELLSRQTYTVFLPALGAVYTLVMLVFQLFRTVLWACYKPYPPYPTDLGPASPSSSRPIMKGPWWRKPSPRWRPRITRRTGWKSSASTTAPPMIPGLYPASPKTLPPPGPAHPVCRQPGQKGGALCRLHPGPGRGLRHH